MNSDDDHSCKTNPFHSNFSSYYYNIAAKALLLSKYSWQAHHGSTYNGQTFVFPLFLPKAEKVMVVDDSLSEGTKETEEKEFTWETVEI